MRLPKLSQQYSSSDSIVKQVKGSLHAKYIEPDFKGKHKKSTIPASQFSGFSSIKSESNVYTDTVSK